jgi:hypothetical protein
VSEAGAPQARRGRKRQHQSSPRTKKLLVAYTDDEFAGIVAAANRADLSPTAYVGSAALAAAVGMEAPGAPLREAMTELMQARTAVNRIGGAVNKLAAKALAGGDVSTAELQAAAEATARSVARVQAAAASVHRAIA